MSICLDDLDRFGVPLRKSFLPESDLVDLIHLHGMTVAQASERKKTGDLPEDILFVWGNYDELVRLRIDDAERYDC